MPAPSGPSFTSVPSGKLLLPVTGALPVEPMAEKLAVNSARLNKSGPPMLPATMLLSSAMVPMPPFWPMPAMKPTPVAVFWVTVLLRILAVPAESRKAIPPLRWAVLLEIVLLLIVRPNPPIRFRQ